MSLNLLSYSRTLRYLIPLFCFGLAVGAVTPEAPGDCMWNEAVCHRGDMVSIGLLATDADMSKLDGMHDVKRLFFMIGPNSSGAPKIDNSGFLHIQSLRDLETLHAMQLTMLTDDALQGLSKLSHLRELRLDGDNRLTDKGLSHLGYLTELRIVDTYGAAITDRGILYLRASADLEDLQLGQSKITDGGVAEIVRFRKLKTLDLQGTRITDMGVTAIATLPSLAWLCLIDTAITDKGMLALRSNTSLRDLYLSSGAISDGTKATLQRALPQLNVHFQ